MYCVKHTSAGVTLNENADPTVRTDFESFINKMIPENDPCYVHVYEGSDDMPAHLKSSVIGASINIPITNYRLNLWYLAGNILLRVPQLWRKEKIGSNYLFLKKVLL